MKIRILRNMEIDLPQISKRAKYNKMNDDIKKIIMKSSSRFADKKSIKQRKSITMMRKKAVLLEALSEEYKIPQGEVIEELLSIIENDYFKEKFQDKLKNRFKNSSINKNTTA